MRTEVLTAVIMKVAFFRNVMLGLSLHFILLLFCFHLSFFSSYASSFLLPEHLILLFLIYSLFLITTSYKFILFSWILSLYLFKLSFLLPPYFPPTFFPFITSIRGTSVTSWCHCLSLPPPPRGTSFPPLYQNHLPPNSAYSSMLRMEAVCSFETLVTIYQTTRLFL
jgi:hypothetical protein